MIVIVRLVSGHDVAGELIHEDVRGLTLRHPLLINYKYTMGGYPAVSFAKYMVFAEADEVPFDRPNVLHVMAARKSFVEFYAHALDKYYFKLNDVVDRELYSHVSGDVPAPFSDDEPTEEDYTDLLDSVPTDKMTMN